MKQSSIAAAAFVALATAWPLQASAMDFVTPVMNGAQDTIGFLTAIPSRHGWKVFVAAALVALALDRLRSRNSGRFEY